MVTLKGTRPQLESKNHFEHHDRKTTIRKYLLSSDCLNGHTLGFHPRYSAKFIFVNFSTGCERVQSKDKNKKHFGRVADLENLRLGFTTLT